ncbi:DUF4968 domain-containing protein [bacterium]|nr:DUF4968 domain-containing protein [bacterium]
MRWFRVFRGLSSILLLFAVPVLMNGCGARTDEQGRFRHEARNRTVELTVLTENMVRVRYLPPEGTEPTPDRGWTTIPLDTYPRRTYPVHNAGDRWEIATGRMTVEIMKTDARVRIVDNADRVLSEDLPFTYPADSLLLLKELRPNASLYGLGEKTGRLDKRGGRYEMWNTDVMKDGDFEVDEDPLYQSHPWVISYAEEGGAWGLYLNTTRRTVFDLGSEARDVMSVRTDGGEIDYFFIRGPRIDQVVQSYVQLTGQPFEAPLWSLGFHQSRWSYPSGEEVRRIAQEFRARDIPCDGLWLDIDYMDRYRIFTWDPERFPRHAEMLTGLKTRGFKPVTILDPGVAWSPRSVYSVLEEGLRENHFVTMPDDSLFIGEVWPGKVVYPDFTKEDAREWWANRVMRWQRQGIPGLWIDMNEPVTWSPNEGFPLDSRWDGDGFPTDHRETRNIYGNLMAKATRTGMLRAFPTRRPFILTRAGFSGIQQYAATWTGDVPSTWEHLRGTVPMLLNLGLSGQGFVGSDIGGFTSGDDPELYVRWLQLGSFTPFFRSHAMQGTRASEPWAYGERIEAISRRVIDNRYELLPYWYDLMLHYHKTGEPPMRPLVYDFDFVNDPAVRNLDDQFMVGRDLLVAPVLEHGARTRDVYLPEGIWSDRTSGVRHQGPKTLMVDAPLDRIPVFVREGGLIPSYPVMEFVGETAPREFFLDAWPAEEGTERSYRHTVDDGVHLNAPRAATDFTMTCSDGRFELSWTTDAQEYRPPSEQIVVRVHGLAQSPSAVHFGAGEGIEVVKEGDLQASQRAWRYEQEAGRVDVKLPYGMPSGRLVVEAPLQPAL